MDHQIEHDGDLGATRIERRQSIALDESWLVHERQCRANRAIETLDVSGLDQRARPPSERKQLVRLFERGGDRLLDEKMPTMLERSLRHCKVRGGRHSDG